MADSTFEDEFAAAIAPTNSTKRTALRNALNALNLSAGAATGALATVLGSITDALEELPAIPTQADIDDAIAEKLSTLNPATVTPAQILAALGGPVAVAPEPAVSVLPTISGTAQVGKDLTATPAVWLNNPANVTGEWYRDGVPTGSINLTRTLTAADEGAVMTYVEKATSARTGAVFTATSLPTVEVIAAAAPVPSNTILPVVTGTPTPGNTLSTSNGTWTNSPTGYTYQWRRAGVDIAGATSSTYVAQTADIGKAITARVTAANGPSSGVISSNSVTVVAALAISGTPRTAQIGLAYGFTPTVVGGSGTRTFSLSGTLPAGLSFSTTTGTISGTPTTAGTTTGLTITVDDPSGSPVAVLGPFSIVRSGTAWDIGLTRTPSYVPAWTRPATIAQGKANGSIPADAIEFETGNNGGPFASTAAGWGAFIDACNAADKSGAIQTPLTSLNNPARKYLFRGLYGAGLADVMVRRTDRTGSSPNNRRCLFMVWKNKVTIRGINFVDCSGILGVCYPMVPLVKSGSLDASPYFTGTDPTYVTFGSGTGANGTNYPVGQLGTIAITGSVNISSGNIVRQIPATDNTGTTSGEKMDDTAWYATTETITLFTGQACTTHTQVRDAINAGSSTHGFRAELNDSGQVRLGYVDTTTRAPIEINMIYTGSGSVKTNNRTPEVDINYCTFTDCDQVFGAVLDVLELGTISVNKNDCPGTWGLVSAPVTRWQGIYAANNNWYDCMPTRTPAVGRTASTLPSGSSQSGRNTFIQLGSDSAVMMRYHGAQGGNFSYVENNRVDRVESTNNTDTVNCAVLSDIRGGFQNTANGKLHRVAYNDEFHIIGVNGAEDSQPHYGKYRGLTVVGNRIEQFGAAYVANTSTQNGSETGGVLLKNPGNYAFTITGIAAAGGGAAPENIVVAGNTFIDGPDGCSWVKIDENGGYSIVEQNLFDGWDNQKGGVDQTAGAGSGLIRITGRQYGWRLNSNRFRRCNPRTATKRVISLWNLTLLTPIDGARYSIAGNEFYLDTVTYTANTPLATYNGSTSGNVKTAFQTGTNRILAPDGTDTGFRWQVVEDSNVVLAGTGTATPPAYGSINYLASYAA